MNDKPLIVSIVILCCIASRDSSGIKYLDPYTDDILYKVDWLSESIASDNSRDVLAEGEGGVVMHSNNKESYRCEIPYFKENTANEDDGSTDGVLAPDVLLGDIFQSKECVYLVEGYWSYELCHGLHLRQFHEDRGQDGKVIDLLEFVLGKQTSQEFPPKAVLPPPLWQYNNKEYPYYQASNTIGKLLRFYGKENLWSKVILDITHYMAQGNGFSEDIVQFTDGTPCDIRDNVGRSVKLVYICEEAHSVVPSLVMVKESTTCEYEALVLTKQLCLNEAYRLKGKPIHSIKCYPTEGSPVKPQALSMYDFTAEVEPERKPPQQFTNAAEDIARSLRPDNPPFSTSHDEKFMISFLTAEYCIHGKTSGWWQHELCFGDHVKQVHMENGIVKQKVLLGYWNEEAHKEWFSKAGKSKQSQTHVTHLYGDGDMCEDIDSPRRVRVKFRCIQELGSAKLSLFLEEPTPCNYILTIEAGFICRLLKTTDKYGLFQYEIA